ncbi:MAG: glycosyltransferase [Salibacteraceae bacterium]
MWIYFFNLALWVGFHCFIHYCRNRCEYRDSKPRCGGLSILICARDESDTIADCLHSIASQKWLPEPIEVIVIDDHSSDNTVQITEEFAKEHPQLGIRVERLDATRAGKRMALLEAVGMASHDMLFLTDADCILSDECLKQHFDACSAENASSIGPVFYESTASKSLLTRMMEHEMVVNAAITEAYVCLGRPIMSNGANTMVSQIGRETLLHSLDHQTTASGDDVFFMHELDRQKKSVAFVREAVVETRPLMDFKELFHQRLRWAAKSKRYKSPAAVATGGFVFTVQTIFVIMLLHGMFTAELLSSVLVILMSKLAIEYGFHRSWAMSFGRKVFFVPSVFNSIAYPFYVVTVGAAALMGIGYKWKDRNYKH